MAQDIYVLTTSKEEYKFFAKDYPAAKMLPFNSLTEDALKEAVKNSWTKFLYIVNPKKDFKNIDFDFVPDKYSENYVHIWNDYSTMCLLNKRDVSKNPVKYTPEQIHNGEIDIVYFNASNISDQELVFLEEPNIFLICQTEVGGKNYIRKNLTGIQDKVKIIVNEYGLTESALNEVIDETTTQYFYIIDSKTKILQEFDFSSNPVRTGDENYVHVWNKSPAVRFMKKEQVETDINKFTDSGWKLGLTEIKNHDEEVFELDVTSYDYLNNTTKYCDVFVLGTDRKWFETFRTHPGYDRSHHLQEELTQSVIEHASRTSSSEFFYIVKEYSKIKEDFDFSFIPKDEWSLDYIHIWENNSDVMLFHKSLIPEIVDIFTDEGITYKKHMFKNHEEPIFKPFNSWEIYESVEDARECKDGYYFVLDSGYKLVDDFEGNYRPTPWDENKIHKWQTINPHTGKVFDYSGLTLYPNKNTHLGEQYVRKPGCMALPYDVIFLSYNEQNTSKNFRKLQKIIPWVQRVHGIKGIYEAHKEAARIANTSMFYVVDADAEILPSFTFSFMPRSADEHKVYVWRSKNPVNDMIYGYGGIKLFPREVLLNSTEYKVDFTTSVSKDFVPVAEISNITRFNTDPFNAWKSAFRECVKLSSKTISSDTETQKRLETWCTVGEDKEFGEYAIQGAKAGRAYGEENKENQEALRKINDFEWLQNMFKQGLTS